MIQKPPLQPLNGLLPQNIDAEQSVLGSLLVDTRAIDHITSFLRPEDFYLNVNAEIYRAMLALHEQNQPTDVVTLSNQLQASDKLDDIGGIGYLASLPSVIATSLHVEHYARIVEKLAVLRRLVDAGGRISNLGYDERLSAEEALEQAEKTLFDISRERVTRDFEPLSNILAQVEGQLDLTREPGSELTGVTTGFIDLDRLTGGLQRSDLIILAARPAMGKTALGLAIAHAVATRAHMPVGIFSVEMAADQVARRFISIEAQLDSQKLRTGRLTQTDWDTLARAMGTLSDAPIFIDDTPALSAIEMRSKARRLDAEQGLGLIVVDYLQLMHGTTTESRVQEISAISRNLKALARDLNVPVLALSQLSRAPEQRPNHEPMLSDLRDSGSIEQDADLVMFIYRDVKYNPETVKPHLAEILVAKHRNGPTGKIHLFFQEAQMKFHDLSKTLDG
ncbi:MAG: replicative DNA helicase [Chloroflexota bacterium]